jgi:polyhydroxyalkanoate synthesis regulator phasin
MKTMNEMKTIPLTPQEEQISELFKFIGTQMSVNEAMAKEINDLKRQVSQLQNPKVSG